MTLRLYEIGMVAVALGCDAFAVGLGTGAQFCAPRQVFRLAFHFGFFQFMMPLIGWMLGRHFLGWTQQLAPWIAFGLLFFIGSKMVYEGIGSKKQQRECSDPTKGLSLIMLSLATSIDALGVGFTLGVLGQGLLFAAMCIGITAGGMTWLAMKLGNRLSERFAHRVEIFGGIILIVIAFKLLFF
ncbi:MAG: manganese efflux pump [Deltaproteobacteria bacterium]|nr:manganese efflux pump [Deltaproteobacteria bacterium]MBW2153859.1 manganese efflux pump [Deltaproteobacteria bacterium]